MNAAVKQDPDYEAKVARLRAARRLLHAREARDKLLSFAKLLHPSPQDPEDSTKSRYHSGKFHVAACDALEKVERGEIKRLIITVPPRIGKSQLASKIFPSWFVGRDPYRSVIVGTYNDTFAMDFGRAVRGFMQTSGYGQVFPNTKLKTGSAAADRLETEMGGNLFFVGVKGSLTGRGGDLLIVDDPIKNSEDAESPLLREKMWEWFNNDLMSRMMTDDARILLIQCMTGDTPVLMADGQERPLRDVRVGDRIATYEEGKVATSTVRNWVNQGPDQVFEIQMASGVKVKANARHPFLVEENGKLTWQRTASLKKGSVILKVTGESGKESFAPPKAAINPPSAKSCAARTTTRNAGRAAFGPLPLTQSLGAKHICATDTGLAKKITTYFSCFKAAFARFAWNRPARQTPARTGTASFASITATIRAKFADFFATIATSLSATGKRPAFYAPPLSTLSVVRDEVLAVVEAGTEDVFDIQVDRTENFIANGLVSHNTRWHEDDLVGRLTDPTNPCYSAEEAATWKIINIPGLAEDAEDVLQRPLGESIWPERFSKDYYLSWKRRDPVKFSALVQQRPSPADGTFFRTEHFREYAPNELPDNLRYYIGVDLAVGQKQTADPSVILTVGVDNKDRLFIVDACWQMMQTDVSVDEIIKRAVKFRPMAIWGEQDHIFKSIGPFLRKRLQEERCYVNLQEVPSYSDKQKKAQPIQGRMSMGMVFWPKDAPWYQAARDELLKFPRGRHDDLVDALSCIGRGLADMIAGVAPPEMRREGPRVGSFAWVKAQGRREVAAHKRFKYIEGL